MARLSGLWHGHPLDGLAAARGMLFPWAPVFLALGIGAWFGWPDQPPAALLAGAGLGAAALALAGARAGPRWQPVWLAAALVLAGFALTGLRSDRVAAPVLGHRFYGPVTGRVVALDRSASDFPRVTLDRVRLAGIAPSATPARVRITLHGAMPGPGPEPGEVVMLTAHLSPPPGPSEPGGFDFRRMAWFQRLGATGYATAPLMQWQPAGAGAWLPRFRLRLAEEVRARIGRQPGAFAAAVATGDRLGITRATAEDLRASNLAHLLAISGLHMGLLTAFVFGALRLALAAIPPAALRLPGKKIAALGALGAAAAYLALSGGNVATQRAFIMVAVMLGAVLADRRALTLRSVALAALVILTLRPESLTGPGFQMSFAATTALVAAFGALRGRDPPRRHRLIRGTATLVFSSAIAGVATAPIAAATFNRIAEYGLLANVLTVPVMGFVVMPAAVVAALLAPFGLAAPALWVMGLGARWILATAHWVAGLSGAVIPVPSPPAWVLPVLALGALLFLMARGAPRWAGLAALAAGFAGWVTVARPLLLVAPDGRLVGLMTGAGRALSGPTGAGFAARVWLQADGDAASQAAAALRPGFEGPVGARRFTLAGHPAVVLRGKGALAALTQVCRPGWIVILAARAPPGPMPCELIDARRLDRSGALAFRPEGGRLAVIEANRATGARPWVRLPRPPAAASQRIARQ